MLWILHIVLGFLATGVLLLPALIYNDTNTFTGLQVAFGYQFSSLGEWVSGDIELSLLSIIAYLLPMFSSIYLIIKKNGFYISLFTNVAAVILLVLVPVFTVVTVTLLGTQTTVDVEWTYGIGLTLAIISSIFSVMISLYVIAYRVAKNKKAVFE